jgi:hypothetical protein
MSCCDWCSLPDRRNTVGFTRLEKMALTLYLSNHSTGHSQLNFGPQVVFALFLSLPTLCVNQVCTYQRHARDLAIQRYHLPATLLIRKFQCPGHGIRHKKGLVYLRHHDPHRYFFPFYAYGWMDTWKLGPLFPWYPVEIFTGYGKCGCKLIPTSIWGWWDGDMWVP